MGEQTSMLRVVIEVPEGLEGSGDPLRLDWSRLHDELLGTLAEVWVKEAIEGAKAEFLKAVKCDVPEYVLEWTKFWYFFQHAVAMENIAATREMFSMPVKGFAEFRKRLSYGLELLASRKSDSTVWHRLLIVTLPISGVLPHTMELMPCEIGELRCLGNIQEVVCMKWETVLPAVVPLQLVLESFEVPR